MRSWGRVLDRKEQDARIDAACHFPATDIDSVRARIGRESAEAMALLDQANATSLWTLYQRKREAMAAVIAHPHHTASLHPDSAPSMYSVCASVPIG